MNFRSLSLIFLAAATGCSQVFFGTVNSLGVTQPPARFVILPGMPGMDTTDLQFKEVRGFVTRGLASRGFIPATAADATMAVFVRYGIGAPQVTAIASSSPVTGWIPGTTTTTQGTITGAAGSAVYGATSTTTGSYGVVGTQTTTSSETSYTRWLMLNGVDVGQFRRNGSLVEIWRTGVVSDGYSGDLRRVLPVLVAQAMPYVGRPTSRGERSMLFENDKRVKALRAP